MHCPRPLFASLSHDPYGELHWELEKQDTAKTTKILDC